MINGSKYSFKVCSFRDVVTAEECDEDTETNQILRTVQWKVSERSQESYEGIDIDEELFFITSW